MQLTHRWIVHMPNMEGLLNTSDLVTLALAFQDADLRAVAEGSEHDIAHDVMFGIGCERPDAERIAKVLIDHLRELIELLDNPPSKDDIASYIHSHKLLLIHKGRRDHLYRTLFEEANWYFVIDPTTGDPYNPILIQLALEMLDKRPAR
jgi:hypothetical protein